MYSITQDSHSTEYVSEKSNRFFQHYQIGKILDKPSRQGQFCIIRSLIFYITFVTSNYFFL